MRVGLLGIAAGGDFFRFPPEIVAALALRPRETHFTEGLSGVVLVRILLELVSHLGLHLLHQCAPLPSPRGTSQLPTLAQIRLATSIISKKYKRI